ncbi:MAG: hypothetical protein WA001_00810 [Patescibacteria group bacterium]
MPDDISLLPEGLRKKEDDLKTTAPPKAPAASGNELKFSIPKDEGEDIEVIEIDEGEVDQVLAGEPPLTRFIYKVASVFDELKTKLFQAKLPEPAPKLPPQFFTPPPVKAKAAPGAVPSPVGTGAAVAPAPSVGAQPVGVSPATPAKPRVIVTPSQTVPHRVRVIKRIRKPVRVSFVSDDDLRLLHIDVPKRRFTFIVTAIVFVLLIGGGWYFLGQQAQAAQGELAKANSQLSDVRSQIATEQASWSSFQDLEPRLKALRSLLDAHISPTRLFSDIETNTLPTVTYSSFSMSADSDVTLLTTADSFETAAEQVKIFQQLPYVTKVEASSYSASYATPSAPEPSSVNFQLVLTLSGSALNASSSTVATAP